MSQYSKLFQQDSHIKAHDRKHRDIINFNIGKYNNAVPLGKLQYNNLDLAKQKAKNQKWKAIENLDTYLEQVERLLTQRGVKVIWAETADEANEAILKICKEKACTTIVKSKSMVTEELHLNAFLEKHKIESVETDLGEYIQQLDEEPPYHIVTPAMHKSKEQIAKLFAQKLNTDPNSTAEELTLIARDKLRKKYAEAQIGITGANFVIADIGGIAITENEGNARLSASMPKTHIVIVGIEKMIPSINDLAIFWPLLSTYGTGQRITSYNTIVTGPRKANEVDGPENMYVVFLDNGRTNMLGDEKTREALQCIRCGACLNVCPVYKNIGGHTYNTTYSGPIGSVITPHLRGMKDWKHLSHASSLCGACTEVCPMGINIHGLLLENRKEGVEKGYAPFAEKLAWRLWKQAMLKRSLMNAANGTVKTKVIGVIGKAWSKDRAKLEFPKKSFNQLWKERRN
ncbi:MAG: iron-sulfur cluster-binding protein [Bacteroidia bacterium]|nr:MAG: iron-sulfur cluster-binding protein [Bacteroidia bacterium]